MELEIGNEIGNWKGSSKRGNGRQIILLHLHIDVVLVYYDSKKVWQLTRKSVYCALNTTTA